MKKVLLLLTFALALPAAAQVKTTGTVALGSSMSVQLDMNNTTSTLTMTLKGPSTRWFGIGFCSTASPIKMSTSLDCVLVNSATTIKDYKPLGGHNDPVLDAVQNWTLVSNNVTGTQRTVVATRPLNTNDTNDYTFNYSTLTTLKIIWAYAASATYTFSGDHSNNKGTATLTFTTVLGVDPLPTLDNVVAYPNPSTGEFFLKNPDGLLISKIRVFNTNAQVIREINLDEPGQEVIPVNCSGLSTGIYFLELSDGTSTSVKRIEIQ